MRQGTAAPQGKWTGNPTGGVKAPEPIILPDHGKRFASTAARLEVLAEGHAMADWLRFMADFSHAQHQAATTLPPLAGIPADVIAQSVDARMPPMAADGHRRDPAWQHGLRVILDHVAQKPLPAPMTAVIADLRKRDAGSIDAFANAFLYGEVAASDVGTALYVAGALQVYFTRMAAMLPVTDLRLLPQRGLCPCCGSTPVSGTVIAAGDSPGARYLTCSLCSTAWNHVRTVCITCGEGRAIMLEGIEGDDGVVKAETCGDCKTYAKMIYRAKATTADPFADDLATLGLDMLVSEAGWARHAPNPLLLMG